MKHQEIVGGVERLSRKLVWICHKYAAWIILYVWLQDHHPFINEISEGRYPLKFHLLCFIFSIDQRFQSDLAGCPKPFWIMSRPRQCCSWSLPLPCCSSTSHRHGLPEARSSPAHAQDWMPLDEVDEKMDGKMDKLLITILLIHKMKCINDPRAVAT